MTKIQMVNIPTQAISFDLYYGGKSVSEMLEDGGQEGKADTMPVTEETPQFKNIFIRDVTCKGAMQAIFLQGLPEMNLENVHLDNIQMEADKGLTCVDADHVEINGLKLITKKLPALEFTNSRNVNVENCILPGIAGNIISINGNRTKNIFLKGNGGTGFEKLTVVGSEVDKGQIKF
jgi:hypothetical protein